MANAHFCCRGIASTFQGFGGLVLNQEWRIRYGHCPTGLMISVVLDGYSFFGHPGGGGLSLSGV